MSEARGNCGTCKWWAGRITGHVYVAGACKRYPPHLGVHKMLAINEWCGEFTPLPKAPDHG